MENSQKQVNENILRSWLIPTTIFLIALSVRIIGLKFGFPLLTHHDEQYIINPLVEMSKKHTLDSGLYNRPNQILYTVLFGYLNLISKLLFNKNFGWAFDADPLFFYFHARLVIAFFGALIPVIAWKIGKLFKGVDFSLPAAILTCFYPSYIVHSHYITGDVINTVFSLAIIMFCLMYLKNENKLWLILACIGVGLNTVEKYPGILTYGIVLVTIGIKVFSHKKQHHRINWQFFFREIAITLTVVILSMFIFAPHLFFKLDQIREILIYESRSTHLGADNLNWFGNMLFYLKVFINSAGWIVFLFALAGIILSVASKQPAMLLLYFGAGYWVALSKLGLHWERWSLPMMITPLLLAAFSITKLWETIKSRKIVKVLVTVFLIVFFSLYALNGLTSSVLLTWQDTRVVALDFLNKNNITMENSISEGYTPFYPRYAGRIFDFNYNDPGQIQYVILSSNIYGRYEAEPDRYKTENDYYSDLRAEATLIAEFLPSMKPDNPWEQLIVTVDYFSNLVRGTKTTYTTGPTIQVFKIP